MLAKDASASTAVNTPGGEFTDWSLTHVVESWRHASIALRISAHIGTSGSSVSVWPGYTSRLVAARTPHARPDVGESQVSGRLSAHRSTKSATVSRSRAAARRTRSRISGRALTIHCFLARSDSGVGLQPWRILGIPPDGLARDATRPDASKHSSDEHVDSHRSPSRMRGLPHPQGHGLSSGGTAGAGGRGGASDIRLLNCRRHAAVAAVARLSPSAGRRTYLII